MADTSALEAALTRIQSQLSTEGASDAVSDRGDQRLIDEAASKLNEVAVHLDDLSQSDSTGPSSAAADPTSGGTTAPPPEPADPDADQAPASETAPAPDVDPPADPVVPASETDPEVPPAV